MLVMLVPLKFELKQHKNVMFQMVVVLKKITAGAMLSHSEASEEFHVGIIDDASRFTTLLSLVPCSCKQRVIMPTSKSIDGAFVPHITILRNHVESLECLLAFLQSQNASAAVGHWLSLLLQNAPLLEHEIELHLPLHFFLDTIMLQQEIEIRITSDAVLRLLSVSSGHATVGQLVVANADYIIDSLCYQLWHLDVNPHVPDVLAAILSCVGTARDILPLLEEPDVGEIAKASQTKASSLPNQAEMFSAHDKGSTQGEEWLSSCVRDLLGGESIIASLTVPLMVKSDQNLRQSDQSKVACEAKEDRKTTVADIAV
ncbi:TELO2 interacting protein 1 [Musa troglodytarum]|uniref:TELO2 interacting protein 1 n=1 Tax=Musa troglodytarum TaxID=320322 RepID=A0A9E7KZD3_9LILI|nr:TELO2 interacting protein 1 [Musa troglodytarum]